MDASSVADTRERILDAALGLFAERGFHGTSMPALAERAGVAAGTPYRHFDGKERIVNEVYRRAKRSLVDALLDGFPFDAPAREQHRTFFFRLVAYFRERPAEFDFLELHHHQPYLDAENLALEQQSLAPVIAFFENGRRAGVTRAMSAEALGAMVWGIFSGLTRAARLGHVEPTDELWAHAEACAWDAVRRRGPEEER